MCLVLTDMRMSQTAMGYRKRHTKEARIKQRFYIDPPPVVEVSLFGCSSRYRFHIVDLSESGLLLTCLGNVFTFNQHSILELVIYPENMTPVYIAAKFVRRVDEKLMAVKVIDMAQETEDRYRELMLSGRPSED